ncbi:acyl-CoA desaturase [Chitinivorax sp. B]|uniref:acyl-CoA desaturase n=1 Tax=Chitinivorax sp. B TaxID=2502235 RepID=UPI0010F758B3|nr:acyl-CoA desaturase [Chitinivorax sp. B]
MSSTLDPVLPEPTDLAPDMRPTLSSPFLLNMQRRAAWLTIGIPTVVTVLAIVAAVKWGVSPLSLWLWVGLHFVGMLGITVGYHRQFSHRAFSTTRPVRALLIFMGSITAQGPVIHWVANHRRHHEYSDRPGDTHSPHAFEGQPNSWLRGMWHAHVGWMFTTDVTNPNRYARDLLRDPLVTRMNRLYPLWVTLGVLLPATVGGVLSGTWTGVLEGGLWGGFVRIFTVHHATWAINSITHRYGKRPFATREYSTNSVWLALPTAGEAWHNCHHAFPSSARFGLAWWQLDIGYLFILALRSVGLAWDLNIPSPAALASKRAT